MAISPFISVIRGSELTGKGHATPTAHSRKEQSSGKVCSLTGLLKGDQIRGECLPRWPPEDHTLHTKGSGIIKTTELSSPQEGQWQVSGEGDSWSCCLVHQARKRGTP